MSAFVVHASFQNSQSLANGIHIQRISGPDRQHRSAKTIVKHVIEVPQAIARAGNTDPAKQVD